METQNGIYDDAGHQLLEQYSNKVYVFAFTKTESDSGSSNNQSATDTSLLTANKDLLK